MHCRLGYSARPQQSTGPGGLPVLFRVGVHSGLVGVRKGARNAIARFNVAGDTVHVAAKLQQEAAPSEIVNQRGDRQTLQVAAEIDTSKGESAVIADHPIDVYRLDARPDIIHHSDVARRYRFPLVNRIDELAALRERLPRAGERNSSIAIVGEAGIGKSRLSAAAVTGDWPPM